MKSEYYSIYMLVAGMVSIFVSWRAAHYVDVSLGFLGGWWFIVSLMTGFAAVLCFFVFIVRDLNK